MNIQRIADFAEGISLDAGNILIKGFRSKDTQISYKSSTNLITNIDKESEEYLFNKIRLEFPDHTIIAEEGSRRNGSTEYVWYIDPLDATNNYAHGIPFFCVSIGVFSSSVRKVIAGIVYDPIHREMFKGISGKGAFLNGENIHVSGTDKIAISILATGFPYNKANSEKNNLREFNAFLPRVQGIRRIGSAALDLSYLACGRIDGYWEPGLKPWDMAGGSLIVEEAGGYISKYDGNNFNVEFPEIVASNGIIHNEMLDILKNNYR